MKKSLILIILTMMLLQLVSCGTEGAQSNAESQPISSEQASSDASQTSSSEEPSEEPSSEPSEEPSSEPSSEPEDDNQRVEIPQGAETVNNLNYSNGNNNMGDNDGPAYCVYSNVGFTKAYMDVAVSGVNINTVRDDGKFINAYIFLGADLHEDGYWTNCYDAGLCWSGKEGGWHLFYNIYERTDDTYLSWYESTIILDSKHDYRIILDTSEADEKTTLIVFDLTKNEIADTATFGAKRQKANGSGTAFYQNIALDFPDDTMVGSDGNYGVDYSTADWQKTVLENTNRNLYMQNVVVTDAKLYKNDEEFVWTGNETHNIGIWPDSSKTEIDYVTTTIIKGTDHTSYRIDLDMNRK